MYSSFSSVQSFPIKIAQQQESQESQLLSTVIYTYTGANQIINPPTGTTKALIKCWGAGGSSRGFGASTNGSPFTTYPGGGGGYTQATLNVTPSDTLNVMVGQAGNTTLNFMNSTAFPQRYGGGGAMGYSTFDTNWAGSSGGGRSGVQKLGLLTSGVYDDIICAGGGGGSGINYQSGNANTFGGYGGGLTGGAGGGNDPTKSGGGGTQSAGGAAATAGKGSGSPPVPSAKYQGASGGSTWQYSSGGGGGYYGGGLSGQFGGGGGGSSYIHSTLVADGGTSSVITQASSYLVANSAELPATYTSSNVGSGGQAKTITSTNTIGNDGKNGLVVISFYS